MRSSVLVLVFIVAGCGKSFQEADAIYKDEAAKLKALEREISAEAHAASKAAYEQYLADNRLPAKESNESTMAAEAMRIAEKEWKSSRRIASGKEWLAGEALEKKMKSVNWTSEDQKKAEDEERIARKAYLAAEKAAQESLKKLKNAVQESERADAAMQAAIEEIKSKAAKAGKIAEEEVRKRRLPEIQVQKKDVDAAYQAKEGAK